MAKAASWASTDAHARKRGEQTGLDTLVVHALNDVDWLLGRETSLVTKLTREVDRLGSTAARLKLKGIDGTRTSGGLCGLIRCNAKNLTYP